MRQEVHWLEDATHAKCANAHGEPMVATTGTREGCVAVRSVKRPEKEDRSDAGEGEARRGENCCHQQVSDSNPESTTHQFDNKVGRQRHGQHNGYDAQYVAHS